MISFKSYISEAKKLDDSGMPINMTPERAINVLEKTNKSISAHISRGGHAGTTRARDLIYRYNDHRDWLREKHMSHWKTYCDKHNWHINHDAWDSYA